MGLFLPPSPSAIFDEAGIKGNRSCNYAKPMWKLENIDRARYILLGSYETLAPSIEFKVNMREVNKKPGKY